MVKRFFRVFLLALISIGVAPVFVNAQENIDSPSEELTLEVIENSADKVVIDRADYDSDIEFNENVNKYINDSNIMGVAVIDTRESISLKDNDLITPKGILLPYLSNIRNLGQSAFSSELLNTIWAQPGIPATLTNSYSVTTNYSNSTSISSLVVTTSLGFNVSKSHTVTYTGGPYTAPKTHNGKKVDHVRIYANPVKVKYRYDIYKPRRNKYYKAGNGQANKPVGVFYGKEFRYQ
ncbi:hypothetical protein CIL05_16465 [Virgibacillus profundi]|uniref:Uncharacterized protein n=1 Tax=Virgibacillus profundi TaxID=2024555 RepID=A0A2A2IA63_9BACI|nr:hypothetical protein [Virgibacillus profundi]PAV28527.1 hypothetical protein CIL05_16465 [Virgibacillus profundi]PXY52700.1 hypothetical protein CIT14_16610 [Virgibacillus profundi]